MLTLETSLTVRLRLLGAGSGRPAAGHAVTLWHCDHPETGARETSDGDGWVSFPVAFPEAGAGGWPHLHFEVFRAGVRVHAAQLALPGDACASYEGRRRTAGRSMAADPCFANGWHLEMPSVTGGAGRGLVAIRTVGIRPGGTG